MATPLLESVCTLPEEAIIVNMRIQHDLCQQYDCLVRGHVVR
jgi:hypothetical protein